MSTEFFTPFIPGGTETIGATPVQVDSGPLPLVSLPAQAPATYDC